MHRVAKESSARERISRILTDIHFWVPLVVLVGGLLLLRMIS